MEDFASLKFDPTTIPCKLHKKKLVSIDLSRNVYRRLLCFECIKLESDRVRNMSINSMKNRYSIDDVISDRAIEEIRAKISAHQESAMEIFKNLENKIDALVLSLTRLKADIHKKLQHLIISNSHPSLDIMASLLDSFQQKNYLEEGEELERYIKHYLSIEKDAEINLVKEMNTETLFELKCVDQAILSLRNSWRYDKRIIFKAFQSLRLC